MAETPTIHPSVLTAKQEEHILVVKRKDLFANKAAWSGLKQVNFDTYLEIINQKKEFLPRSLMETDPTYKQIIPYLVFKYQETCFLMQRQDNASEKRLQNKYSLGIGGHIRKEDLTEQSIFDWAQREFHEEVAYEGNLIVKPLGILNDDSNAVGQVHIGFVILLEGEHANISHKFELKSGELLTLDNMKPYFTQMEPWSQIVFEFLSKHRNTIHL